MDIKQVDHIGIAVKSINDVISTYSNGFNIRPSFIEEIEDQKVKAAGIKMGDTMIEFLEPTGPDSPISKFLEKRGNAIHHIAYQVRDIDKQLKKLKELGFKLIDESPRAGAGNKKIAFIHPKSTNGILIELCETG